ncbi:MAG: hotdog fold thioesterase [Chitinophagales bacterium]
MAIWKKPTDTAYLENTLNKNTLGETLGIEITQVGEDFVEGRMPVDQRTKQPFGLLHGGASVALAETLASVAGFLSVTDGKNVVGVEINANHLRAVREGYVIGRATPIRLGRTMQVWEIKIVDERDRLVCISRMTGAVVGE